MSETHTSTTQFPPLRSYELFLRLLGKCQHTLHNDGERTLDRVLTTCSEMLQDRGHAHVKRSPSVPSCIERSEPVLTTETTDVYVVAEPKVSVRFLRTLSTSPKACLLISLEGPTSFARKEQMEADVEHVCVSFLLNNVTKHELVPKCYRVPSPPPGVELEQMPLLCASDPLTKYYRWPTDTIVCFERCFGGGQPTLYYRKVSAQ